MSVQQLESTDRFLKGEHIQSEELARQKNHTLNLILEEILGYKNLSAHGSQLKTAACCSLDLEILCPRLQGSMASTLLWSSCVLPSSFSTQRSCEAGSVFLHIITTTPMIIILASWGLLRCGLVFFLHPLQEFLHPKSPCMIWGSVFASSQAMKQFSNFFFNLF